MTGSTPAEFGVITATLFLWNWSDVYWAVGTQRWIWHDLCPQGACSQVGKTGTWGDTHNRVECVLEGLGDSTGSSVACVLMLNLEEWVGVKEGEETFPRGWNRHHHHHHHNSSSPGTLDQYEVLENMDGTTKHKRQLKQEKANPQKLLGLEECRVYFVRLGEPLKNFKQRVIRIGVSFRRIILSVVQGNRWTGQD